MQCSWITRHLIVGTPPPSRGGSSFWVVQSEELGGRDSNEAPGINIYLKYVSGASLESLPPGS